MILSSSKLHAHQLLVAEVTEVVCTRDKELRKVAYLTAVRQECNVWLSDAVPTATLASVSSLTSMG